jgi:hypothetical protein
MLASFTICIFYIRQTNISQDVHQHLLTYKNTAVLVALTRFNRQMRHLLHRSVQQVQTTPL